MVILSNVQKIWMIFIKILNIIIQIKKEKYLIVIDDMNADILSNKNLSSIVTELFIRGRKLSSFLVFIAQSYSSVPKDIRLNSTHYFVMKSTNKREIQQIAFNHPSDINFQDFMNLF